MIDRRLSSLALLLLPAGLVTYFAFNAGGYFPTSTAYVAMVLAVALALRASASTEPFRGAGVWLIVGGGGLALFSLVALLSATWSHAPGLALTAFDHDLVYVLALLLFGCVAHTRVRLIWILRALAAAIFVVCGIALITRVLPHVWPTAPNISNDRLSFPVTYWNVLGLLSVFGIILCAHLASDERGHVFERAAAAGGVPILASTLYFTFSRGSIAVCVFALVIYVFVARPRGLLSVVLTVLPATAIALKVDYDANLLATPRPTSAGAVQQGHHVAVVVIVCAVAAALVRAGLALTLDCRLREFHLAPQARKRTAWIGWSSLVVAAVIAVVLLSGKISHEYHLFLKPAGPGRASDLRTRLTDPGNNGRLEMWKIAWHEFEAAPILGQGAGTYKNAFLQHRYTGDFVLNAHSLYMETLDELGVVGLALLLVAILATLVRTGLRCRGPDRPLYAAVLVLLLAWALESGIDWDWQMPVVTVVAFALGGVMLADSPTTSDVTDTGAKPTLLSRPLTTSSRTVLGVLCLLIAVAPAYVWLSQRKLNQANAAFAQGNYRPAIDEALSSISILGVNAEAYELIAYSDLHRDMPGVALKAMRKAVSLDRNNWDYAYGLALMEGAAGLNPLAEARRALALNPKEPLVQDELASFKAYPPSQWPSDAAAMADAINNL